MNVRKNLVANLLGQGWSALLNIVAVPVYLKLLGVESFGLIGFSVVVVVLASLLDGGMATTLNRSMVHFHAGKADAQTTFDLLRSAESVIWGAASLVGIGCVLLGPTLADWLLDAHGLPPAVVSHALALSIIVALMRVVEAIYRAALLGLDCPITVNLISVVGATLRVFGPMPLILFADGNVLTFFWVQLAVSTVSLLAFAGMAHIELEGTPFGRGRFHVTALREIFAFAGAAFAIASLAAFANQTDKLLAARLTSLTSFGYYSAATTVATGIYQLVLPAFQSFYPKLSLFHAIEQQRHFDRLVLKMAGTIGFVAGVPIAFIILNSREVIFAWTGNAEVAMRSGPLLFWLCFGTLANGIFYVALAAVLAAGRPRIAVLTTVALLVALFPLLLIGWHASELVGLATAWSGAMVCWSLATLILAGRVVSDHSIVRGLLTYAFAPFVIALVSAAALRRVAPQSIGQGQAAEALLVILTAGAVAIVTTIILCALIRLMSLRQATAT